MYILARDYFPNNSKLDIKIQRLQARLEQRRQQRHIERGESKSADIDRPPTAFPEPVRKVSHRLGEDDEYHIDDSRQSDEDYDSAGSFRYRKKAKARPRRRPPISPSRSSWESPETKDTALTPRTKQLLDIVNTRDLAQIRCLRGVGAKKAGAIRDALCADESVDELQERTVHSLAELGRLKGVGNKMVEIMRVGLGESGSIVSSASK